MLHYACTPDSMSRRAALQLSACGFGYLAFQGLVGEAMAKEAANPLAIKPPHFPAKAKRVIFLCMTGGPSHLDLFDHKPHLTKDDGKAPPAGRGRGFGGGTLMASQFKFQQHGANGMW